MTQHMINLESCIKRKLEEKIRLRRICKLNVFKLEQYSALINIVMRESADRNGRIRSAFNNKSGYSDLLEIVTNETDKFHDDTKCLTECNPASVWDWADKKVKDFGGQKRIKDAQAIHKAVAEEVHKIEKQASDLETFSTSYADLYIDDNKTAPDYEFLEPTTNTFDQAVRPLFAFMKMKDKTLYA